MENKITVTSPGTTKPNEYLKNINSSRFIGRLWRSKRSYWVMSGEDYETHKDKLKQLRITKSREQF